MTERKYNGCGYGFYTKDGKLVICTRGESCPHKITHKDIFCGIFVNENKIDLAKIIEKAQ